MLFCNLDASLKLASRYYPLKINYLANTFPKEDPSVFCQKKHLKATL